jgi:hypothetical protein
MNLSSNKFRWRFSPFLRRRIAGTCQWLGDALLRMFSGVVECLPVNVASPSRPRFLSLAVTGGTYLLLSMLLYSVQFLAA